MTLVVELMLAKNGHSIIDIITTPEQNRDRLWHNNAKTPRHYCGHHQATLLYNIGGPAQGIPLRYSRCVKGSV